MENFKPNESNCNLIKVQKLFIFFAVIVLCFQGVNGQCKLDKTKDEFGTSQTITSKDLTIISVFPIIGDQKPWRLDMHFMITTSGSPMISLTHKSQTFSSALKSIYFKFSDGTVLKKEVPNNHGDFEPGSGYSYTYTLFDLPKEELDLFVLKDLDKVQVIFEYFPGYPVVEKEISKINIEKIKKDATCILGEVNSGNYNKDEAEKGKCKYQIDKIDSFTKQRIVLTNLTVLFNENIPGGSHFFQVGGCSTNGVNGLKFFHVYSSSGISNANEPLIKASMLFNQVDILLENDDIINLKTDEVSEYLQQTQRNLWSMKEFQIQNDSTWLKIKATPIKAIRILLNGKEMPLPIFEKKNSKSIMEVINCIDELGILHQK